MASAGNEVSLSDINDLKKDITVVICIVGGIIAVLSGVGIIILSILCFKASSLKKQIKASLLSLKSIESNSNKIQAALDRFPKNIVQFPITKSGTTVGDDDDDRSGTEPASPIFFRKGYTPTALAPSLVSVSEVPGKSHMANYKLQRNNALPPAGRIKPYGPPVPPKRAHSFNNASFNY